MTLLALSFLTPYFYYIPQSTLAAVLISAVVFMIDFKIITILWKGSSECLFYNRKNFTDNSRQKKFRDTNRINYFSGRDAIATICTFTISLIFNVETGLLLGTVFNMIYLLNLSARPKIGITECQVLNHLH